MHSILKSKLDWEIDLGLFKQTMDDFEIPADITQTPPSFLKTNANLIPGFYKPAWNKAVHQDNNRRINPEIVLYCIWEYSS